MSTSIVQKMAGSKAKANAVQAMLGEKGSQIVQAVGSKIKASIEKSMEKKNSNQEEPPPPPPTPEEIIEESFASSSQWAVKQKFHLLEALAGAAANFVGYGMLGGLGEIANKYNVYKEDGSLQYRTVEESEKYGWTGRCLCRPHHKLRLHVQHEGQEIMYLDRECKLGCCFSCCDICRQEMTVHVADSPRNATGNTPMARIREPFLGGGFSPTLEVMDREGKEIATIQADAMCCIGGFCCDHTFSILDPKTRQKIGYIIKPKPEMNDFDHIKQLFSDGADVFVMNVPENEMTSKEKAAMLSALHLIEYWLFEGEGDLSVNFISRTYNCKCCDLYCCGCVIPLGCKSWFGGQCCCC